MWDVFEYDLKLWKIFTLKYNVYDWRMPILVSEKEDFLNIWFHFFFIWLVRCCCYSSSGFLNNSCKYDELQCYWKRFQCCVESARSFSFEICISYCRSFKTWFSEWNQNQNQKINNISHGRNCFADSKSYNGMES